eukprot:jgi/Botrbrau1/19271/Bobra.0073s0020.2
MPKNPHFAAIKKAEEVSQLLGNLNILLKGNPGSVNRMEEEAYEHGVTEMDRCESTTELLTLLGHAKTTGVHALPSSEAVEVLQLFCFKAKAVLRHLFKLTVNMP